MKANLKKFGAVLAVGAAIVATVMACSSSTPDAAPPGCGPSTCDGCCTPSGTCKTDESSSFCGVSGSACVQCTVDKTCVGGACQVVVIDSGMPDLGSPDTGPAPETFTFPSKSTPFQVKDVSDAHETFSSKIKTIRSAEGTVKYTPSPCGGSMPIAVWIDGVHVTDADFVIPGTAGPDKTWSFAAKEIPWMAPGGEHTFRYVAQADLDSSICSGNVATIKSGSVTIHGDF